MNIIVGSQNKGKIQAVKQAMACYDTYHQATVIGSTVASGVPNQPVGLTEIIQGAKNRAVGAYQTNECLFGVGLESGIFLVPHTKSNYMDTTACAIFDGQSFHIGLSSCFEYPQIVIDGVIHDGKEVTDLAVELGFAKSRSFREGKGMIGTLTNGVVTRIAYSQQAVHTALIQLLHPDYY